MVLNELSDFETKAVSFLGELLVAAVVVDLVLTIFSYSHSSNGITSSLLCGGGGGGGGGDSLLYSSTRRTALSSADLLC